GGPIVDAGSEHWEAEWRGVRLATLPRPWWAPPRIRGFVADLRVHAPLVTAAAGAGFDIVHGHEYGDLRAVRAHVRVAHHHNSVSWRSRREIRSFARGDVAHVAVSRF